MIKYCNHGTRITPKQLCEPCRLISNIKDLQTKHANAVARLESDPDENPSNIYKITDKGWDYFSQTGDMKIFDLTLFLVDNPHRQMFYEGREHIVEDVDLLNKLMAEGYVSGKAIDDILCPYLPNEKEERRILEVFKETGISTVGRVTKKISKGGKRIPRGTVKEVLQHADDILELQGNPDFSIYYGRLNPHIYIDSKNLGNIAKHSVKPPFQKYDPESYPVDTDGKSAWRLDNLSYVLLKLTHDNGKDPTAFDSKVKELSTEIARNEFNSDYTWNTYKNFKSQGLLSEFQVNCKNYRFVDFAKPFLMKCFPSRGELLSSINKMQTALREAKYAAENRVKEIESELHENPLATIKIHMDKRVKDLPRWDRVDKYFGPMQLNEVNFYYSDLKDFVDGVNQMTLDTQDNQLTISNGYAGTYAYYITERGVNGLETHNVPLTNLFPFNIHNAVKFYRG